MTSAVLLGAVLVVGYAAAEEMTAEQNVEEQARAHLIPGKTLKAKGPS
jgi:hypothetical protein